MIYRFYKNETGWFIDLPNYPLSKAHLAMVKGADILLNQLSENGNEIYAEISTQPIPDYTDVLDRVKKLGLSKGAIYKGNKIKINYKSGIKEIGELESDEFFKIKITDFFLLI